MTNDKKYAYTQPVTRKNLDAMCDRYTMCGWKEIDIICPEVNQVEAVVFEWQGTGSPSFPITSDL